MRYVRHSRPTLQAVELDHGDELVFICGDASEIPIRLISTGAEITSTTLSGHSLPLKEQPGAVTNYRFWCELTVGNEYIRIEREVATQSSFYEPTAIAGLNIWFDACFNIFNFLRDDHGGCAPGKHARFAIHEGHRDICPVPLLAWCPLPANGLNIANCYNGEDVWMGAYRGASAHSGLDINHAVGTPITAPLDFHEHGYFNSLAMGHNNNRHRGLHHWPDGSTWVLQCHHMNALLVPIDRAVSAGEIYASGAGVLNGMHEHSHFVFKVRDEHGEVLLDPWILFWKMLRDRRTSFPQI